MNTNKPKRNENKYKKKLSKWNKNQRTHKRTHRYMLFIESAFMLE